MAKGSGDEPTIALEIVGHFSSDPDSRVNVTSEINTPPNGFPESLQRIVRANSRTLGFHNAEFEED